MTFVTLITIAGALALAHSFMRLLAKLEGNFYA